MSNRRRARRRGLLVRAAVGSSKAGKKQQESIVNKQSMQNGLQVHSVAGNTDVKATSEEVYTQLERQINKSFAAFHQVIAR